MKMMSITAVTYSPPYILFTDVRPSVGGGSGPLGLRSSARIQRIFAYGILRYAGHKE